MKRLRHLSMLVIAALAMLFAVAPAAGAWTVHGKTCTGGMIASGTYRTLTIAGSCTIPDGGKVTVQDGLVLRPRAQLNAVTASTVRIYGGIRVGPGALLGLGCSLALTQPPFPGAPPICTGVSHDTVYGRILADHALTMYLDGLTVYGDILSFGGGQRVTGPNPGGCEEQPGALNLPIKDNVINGNVIVAGWRGCWLGYIRNQQHGDAIIVANHTASTDSDEIVTNRIHGNLICIANTPPPQFGDSGGSPNSVTGHKIGQCAHL